MSHHTKSLLAGSLGVAVLTLGSLTALAAGPHVEGNHFVIDGAPAAECAVGATCVIAVKLAAQAEFHINQQYPYKFTAVPVAGVTYLGADAANPHIFTKTA